MTCVGWSSPRVSRGFGAVLVWWVPSEIGRQPGLACQYGAVASGRCVTSEANSSPPSSLLPACRSRKSDCKAHSGGGQSAGGSNSIWSTVSTKFRHPKFWDCQRWSVHNPSTRLPGLWCVCTHQQRTAVVPDHGILAELLFFLEALGDCSLQRLKHGLSFGGWRGGWRGHDATSCNKCW